MRERIQRLLFSIGLWCFVKADRRVDYIDALKQAETASSDAANARAEAGKARRQLRELLRAAQLADGLLSSGNADVAQEQLRIGIINVGGIASVRRPRADTTGAKHG